MSTLELTNCYQCDEQIETLVGMVHPLCDECDTDFLAWMDDQIRMIDNASQATHLIPARGAHLL